MTGTQLLSPPIRKTVWAGYGVVRLSQVRKSKCVARDSWRRCMATVPVRLLEGGRYSIGVSDDTAFRQVKVPAPAKHNAVGLSDDAVGAGVRKYNRNHSPSQHRSREAEGASAFYPRRSNAVVGIVAVQRIGLPPGVERTLGRGEHVGTNG